MRRRMFISLLLLCVAIILMLTAVRYFFLYLVTNEYAGSVMFYAWMGLGAFYGALRTKPVFGRRTIHKLTN